MKVLILVCIALFASAVSAKSVDLKEAQLEEIRGFLSDLWNNVIFAPVDNLAQSLAGMGAQLFAGISLVGLDALGKRDDKGIFDDLYNSVYNTLNNAVMSTSLDIAIFLAGIANNGLWNPFGKRDLDVKGLISDLVDAVYPMVNNAVMSTSWTIATILAGVANNGLTNPFGKREDQNKNLINQIYNIVYPLINNAVFSNFLSTAISLAQIALGKPPKGNFFSDLWNNVIFAPVDNLAQSLAAMGAQFFAGLSLVGLDGLIGKRDADKGLTDTLSQIVSSAVQSNMDTIQNLVQDWASLAANLLAGMSLTGLGGLGALGRK